MDVKTSLETITEKLANAFLLTGTLCERDTALDTLAEVRRDMREAYQVTKELLKELEAREEAKNDG